MTVKKIFFCLIVTSFLLFLFNELLKKHQDDLHILQLKAAYPQNLCLELCFVTRWLAVKAVYKLVTHIKVQSSYLMLDNESGKAFLGC